MSIKSNAEIIRDETTTGANTATRVGGNLVEVADDLIAKQTAIDLNTAKVGITTDQATAIDLNTAKVGITTDQATAIVDNTAEVLKAVKVLAISPVQALEAWFGSQAQYTALGSYSATVTYTII
jgi:urocanate hydratase